MLRVIFMGTSSFASSILKALLENENIDVLSLFTKPDKLFGRGYKQIKSPDTKEYLIKNDSLDIKIYQPPKLDYEVAKKIETLKPDFIVVASYGNILPKSILDIATCINLHSSILPKYRGSSPIHATIINDDKQSGITAILMNEEMDKGDILGISYIDIKEYTTFERLQEKLSKVAGKLLIKVLQNFCCLNPMAQFDCISTIAKKIKKQDGLIEFMNAKEIYLKYKALFTWPGIFLKSNLKLKKIALISKTLNGQPSKISKIKKDSIIVECKRGSLEIFEVQPPSKKNMTATSYITGKRLKVGDNIF